PEEHAVNRDVAIDRLFEIASQLDDARRDAVLRYERQAVVQQALPDEVDDGPWGTPDRLDSGGLRVPGVTIDYDFNAEVTQQWVPRPARARRDLKAERASELNEHAADTSRGA